MVNEHNTSPINIRKGKVILDGVEIMDGVSCTINFIPDVWSARQLDDKTPSRRWLGYDITGNFTRRRSTPWLKEKIKEYIRTGRTPELTIQGYMDDNGSDFYAEHGADLVTCVGAVLTGDLPLTRLDSNGDIVDDVINFGAKDIV